jgi:hypothetical protein
VSLAAAAVVLGAGRAGQGFQGRQQGLAGLGVQEPAEGDHAVQGGGQPQAALLVASFGQGGGGVGVGDQPQMRDHSAEVGWVEVVGGLQQDWFGLDCGVGGQVSGAVGQHRGVGGGELAVG